jgi:mono/diheme cytochrome c family protein
LSVILKKETSFLMVLGSCLLSALAVNGEGTHEFSPKDRVLVETLGETAAPESRVLLGIAFNDIEGKSHRMKSLLEKGPVVFVFTASECPMARRYSMRMKRLFEDFESKGVSFFAVHSNADDSAEAVREHAREFPVPFPVVKDDHGYLARRLAATTTPQAFVIGQGGRVAYRGALDDNRYEKQVTTHYLADAIRAVLGNQEPASAQIAAVGCAIHLQTADEVEQVTYSEHVARIFQDNCQSCHRAGEVAPFGLTSFKKARAYSKEIREQVLARNMPPWKPAHGFGEFQDDTSLSDDEIRLLVKWIDQGAAQGDPAAEPPAPQFPEGWENGEPDLVVSMSEDYSVGPEGEDDYRHFIIRKEDLHLPEDMYVSAVDVQPGNRSVVHHVLVYVDRTGRARELDAQDPGYGYTRAGGTGFEIDNSLGGWAPGERVSFQPHGYGKRLARDGDIVLQVHYYRTGRTELDRTKVGFYFSKVERPKAVETRLAINQLFSIPPGERDFPVSATYRLEQDFYVTAVSPHMHQMGTRIKLDAQLPGSKGGGASEIPLIYIKDWDFAWQGSYRFKQLVFLPKGSLVKLSCLFDNLTDRPVTWGEKTSDEMAIGFLSVIKAEDWDGSIVSNR